MKSIFKVSLLAATVLLAVGCQKEEAPKMDAVTLPAAIEFTTEDDKAAYAIGASLAKYLSENLEKQTELGLDLKKELVLAGVQDSFDGKSSLTDEEIQTVLQQLDERVSKIVQEQAEAKAAAVIQSGNDYRANFEKEAGVTKTDSGLMYQVMKEGTGAKPAATDTVMVDYVGTLTDGTKFDSSIDRGVPATFPLDRVIPGWTEGVQLMSVGSKFKFVIPAELAYGAQDTPTIPANSTLVFEVELKEINPKAEEAAAVQ
ncbi:FKBP-type peptidyl-prolyl cis-trans isomerase [Aliivibrio kagoshimensis]|uniref:FKBP-type peptidyl-prolyl cis-trans isomerase n=1 Tax=Aliivibrio kagoshimensis TaxID=2910230 RepID=UPI003D11CE3A